MTRKRLIATIGLPGSGKSTWTLRKVEQSPETVCRANRDALRIAHAGRRLGIGRQEAVVTDAQYAMIRSAFAWGYETVIVDDTNLHGVGKLREVAEAAGAEFEVKDFRTVPLETCILRDKLRQGAESVGEDVIRKLHNERVLPWLRERAREVARQETEKLVRGTSPYDFQPGDVWVDTAIKNDVHTDGTHWHVRTDANGDPELYEPGGPGRVPASDAKRLRGGFKLISRSSANIGYRSETPNA